MLHFTPISMMYQFIFILEILFIRFLYRLFFSPICIICVASILFMGERVSENHASVLSEFNQFGIFPLNRLLFRLLLIAPPLIIVTLIGGIPKCGITDLLKKGRYFVLITMSYEKGRPRV